MNSNHANKSGEYSPSSEVDVPSSNSYHKRKVGRPCKADSDKKKKMKF